jgi:transposase
VGHGTTFIGLDVHKRSVVVAVRQPGRRRVQEETLPNEPRAIARWSKRWLDESQGRLRCAYEAGACGYALQRQLEQLGVTCEVIAPSLVPRKPGERIKTDRRDARKFLLRRGMVYPAERKAWTQAHRSWLETLRFDAPWEQAVFDDYRLAVEQIDARIATLDRQLGVLAQEPAYRQAVGALRCFRGIDTRTALGLVTELHGIERFRNPRGLMAFVGLVPSEASSGEKQRRGAITKAGNSHVRRLLIEAAWHARHKPAIPQALRMRREGQPPEVVARADEAQKRLHARYWRLILRGKPSTVAATAVARELAGFVWAALRTEA